MKKFLKRLSAPRIIALGFALVILLGSLLLILPCSINDNVQVNYIDALYTSTSAVCITGLITVDTADTFTPLGQFIIATLIQIGGLGVTCVGAGIILVMGKKVNIKGQSLIREAMNLDTGKGIIKFVKNVFISTLAFEFFGALLSFFVFAKDYPLSRALGISLFHSVASFNNAGFDILGNMQSLVPYKDNIFLNIVTSVLIIFGGIGFLVIREVLKLKFKWRKFSMHTKIVISVSASLTVIGTLLIKFTENITWLGAFFMSVSTRTAGFSTYPLGNFSSAGIMVTCFLMFIGASPGSTGGGIKTTTFFSMLMGIKSSATNKTEKAFKYSMPADAFRKACVISIMAFSVIISGTYLLLILEPHISFTDALCEITSAFATVGLSTGITPTLSNAGKVLSVVIMYMGRLGPMTIATLWYFTKGERVRYPVGNISIG